MVCFYSATVGAQTTENFETETAGAFTFSEGGFSFSSGTANFDIENFGSAGAGGSDQYIDNFDDQGAGKIYAISITGGASLFSMQSMDVYVSSLPDGAFPTDDGTITVSGRTGATVVYTATYNSGNTPFPLDFTADNGFFNIDFSNMPGIGDQSSINVDNIQITLGGAFIYAAIDDFEFDDEVLNTDPPEVQSITLVGSPSSTATSVDFLVTFNEDAVNVDVSDFVTDLVGASGNISGISGSGSSYTVTVSSITGEGTVSIDLIAGNDIEDTLGNTPSPAFMTGAIFNASRCFIETFESFGAGGNTFTSNGVGFETSDANFNITFLNNGGASGSQFLDNLGDQGTGKSYSITTTGTELFSVNTAGIYVSSMADGAFPTDDGTLTIEGRLSGSTIYTITKNSGFLTDFTTNNGYNPIDFAANGTINVDELRITIGGAFIYVSLDDFEHCPEVLTTDPPTIQSISLVGNPPASSASVDFTVIFNEDALNVSIDDFMLTSTGSATGTIAGIAGTGNNYTVSVSGISGEGTLRLDLLAGTDIEDTDSNTPPPPFNEGEVFLVSLCNVETFEAVAIGGNTWTTNGTPFMSSVTFKVDEFVNAGAGNSDRYLDNVDDQGTGKTFSIAITDTSEITMNQLAVYVSSIADGAQPTDDGTLTVVANLDGVMQYTITKNTGFPTSLVPDNGFYLLDFSAEGGTDNSATLIDELVFTIGGSFVYIGVDNFEFCSDPPPVAVCQDITVQLDATGNASVTPAQVDGGSTDNSGSVTLISVSPNTFDCSNVGLNTVTLTVEDNMGQQSSCTAMVTVEDNTTPTAICQPFTASLDATGNITITGADVDGGSTAACGIMSLSVSPSTFTCAELGTPQTVTLTVTGANGNTDTCTTTVTINDPLNACNQPPMAVCQPVVVNADGACMGTAVAADFDGGSSDPDMDPLTFTVSPAGPYPLGITNVTLTVSDGTLTDICMTTITVNDVTPPMITCPAGPIASVCGDDVVFADPTVTDDCGLVIAPASIPGFTVFGTLGNSTYFISDVTATGPDAFAFAIANGYELLTINNSNENDYISSQLVAFGIGNIMNGYNDIAVEGTFEWQSGQPSNYTNWNLGEPNNNGPGEDYTQVFSNGLWNDIESGTLTRYILEFSNGPVQVTGIPSGNPYPQGTTTNTFYVEDASGNSVTCSFDVIVTDNVPPMIACPAPITMDNDPGICGAIVTYTTPVGTDNCTGSTTLQIAGLPSGATFPIGTTTNTFEVTDAAGNIDTCTFDVTVNDIENPVITCEDVTVELDANGMATIVPADIYRDSFLYDVTPTTYGPTAGSGTLVTLSDDQVSGDLPVGFVFNFFGNDYSQFRISSNGFIGFDNLTDNGCCSGEVVPEQSAFEPKNLIALCWDDLNPPSGGTIDYFTVGVVPNRVLIVNYNNVVHFNSGPGIITGQIKLFETSNRIEIHTANQNDSGIHTQGIQNIDGTLGYAVPGRNGTSWTATNDAFSFVPLPSNISDNCGIASITMSQTDFTCADIGTVMVDVTVTDTSGNTAMCVANITVEDNINPVAVCNTGFVAQLDATGSVTITGVDVDGGSTDNCGVTSITVSPDTFDCSAVGTAQSVTLTVMDAAGNIDTCTTTVTIEDMVAPAAMCAAPFTVQLDAAGIASITVADIENGSTDACGIATTTIDVMDFTCADIGPNTVTLTVIDVNGNMSTCTTIVTVEDMVAPIANCAAPFTVQLDVNGMASITVADIENGSTDACGIATTTIDVMDFTCADVGPNTVTLTVTDVNGNMSTCTTIVTVEDMVAPVVNCAAPFTVQLDAAGMASITVADIDNGSTDACGIATTTIDVTDFTCADVGPNTVTLTVTDVNGNISTCTTIVTVEDNVAPVANCAAPFTVQLDAAGIASITVADIDNGSNDACGIASTTIDVTDFTCADVGPNTVTLTVTDVNGNISTCTTIVTVEDNVAPVANCAAPFTVQLDAAGIASITVADIDNGSTDACGIASTTIDVMDFTCADVGPNTVTLTVTDVNGNISTCTTIVTVEDSVAPVALCMNITVPLAADGTATITPADVDGGSTDACGIASTTIDMSTFDCSNVGPNNVILTVTDINGNVSTCTAVVTIEDVTAPVIACPADISINTTPGDCFAEVSFPDAIALDACGITTITQTMGDPSGSMFPVGDTLIEFTATDVNGNSSTCMFTITVMDMEPAMAVCQDITVQLDGNGMVTINPADVDGGSSDNCGIASTSIDIDSFDCSNVGPNNVTLTVTDVNGNVSTCIAVVTVEDIEAPMVVCQDITVQLDETGNVTITASDLDNGSTDNCTIADFTLDIDTFDCSNVGPNTVIVTVTDASGNTATCTATVTVEDITAPELVCMDFTLELGADGTAILDVANVIASNTDACGIDTSAVDITEYDCSDIGTPVMVEVFTQDVNGNISSCMATVTVIDALAPVVTCPADITVDPGAGNINYEVPDYVALGDATAIDNCTDPVVIFTQDPAAGTFLADGVYPVTITAEDEYGNVGSCTFTLTVESVLGVPANEISLATLTMYPNPAKDYVILSNPQAINLEKVSIYDVNGRLVRNINLNNMGTEKTMDITDLQSAMYMFVIESDHGVITKQILKE
ncbi:hypothetical protein ULMS_10060 [Patiriisocius marinistellae]|uniref:HYR domain-containing protein n=2 Tax=Patiriisocius marinistellae TaxID=2494560 RepID=A0A5J4FW68_9FLAO|nr:hypothetical protein ULMS_10060 [Patiriisocius marinistellae]